MQLNKHDLPKEFCHPNKMVRNAPARPPNRDTFAKE